MNQETTAGNDGVEGNARLTALVGAVLLVALAVEGVTVLGVREMLAVHVFVGLFVIPVTCLKLATTGYRFLHYYRGTAAYRQKGPPHPILRIAAPLVVIATVLLLGTGVALLIVGPDGSDTWITLHQGSFIAWFALTTVHVLGHALETWKLTTDEMRSSPPVPRRTTRVALVATSLIIGLAIGIASLSFAGDWAGDWKSRPRHDDGDAVAAALFVHS
jgi:uncharacterized membrane protein YidH (DUF202 family)